MSFDALAWAAKQSPGSSGAKLVLLGLAECADRTHGIAFPSVAALVEFSCLDRKSVMSNITKLEEAGFITDTGRRCGKTNQVKVYQLNLETVPKTEQSQKRNSPAFPRKGPKNGTRNKSEPVRNSIQRAIPEDWWPEEFAIGTESRKVVDSWPPGELPAQVEQFRANHAAKGNKFSSPQQAWSTWVLNTRKFGIGRNAQPASKNLAAATAAFGHPSTWRDDQPF